MGKGFHKPYKRFQDMYQWTDLSFTRLQLLRVGSELGFTKIIIFDADTLVLGDMRPLFNLKAPAGILSLDESPGFRHSEWHNKKLPDSYVKRAIEQKWGIRGSLLLLDADDRDFTALIHALKKTPYNRQDYIGSYGDTECFLGPDERHLTEVLQDRHGWTHIKQSYCMVSWHTGKIAQDGHSAVGLHFVSQKPWVSGEWYDDFDLWYSEAEQLLKVSPHLRIWFNDPHWVLKKSTGRPTQSNDSWKCRGQVVLLPSHPLLPHVVKPFIGKEYQKWNNRRSTERDVKPHRSKQIDQIDSLS